MESTVLYNQFNPERIAEEQNCLKWHRRPNIPFEFIKPQEIRHSIKVGSVSNNFLIKFVLIVTEQTFKPNPCSLYLLRNL